MVRRGKDPGRGRYAFPGGSLEFGETLADGVAREVQEETGLTVKVLDLLFLSEVLPAGDATPHFVLLDFGCDVVSGDPRAGSDAEEVRWAGAEAARALPLTVNMSAALGREPIRRFLGWS